MLDFNLPLPPSYHRKGKTALLDDFKRAVSYLIGNSSIGDGEYELVLHFHANWYTKDGAILRKDLKNLVWHLEDAIAEAMGYDDCQHFRIVCDKRNDPNDTYVRVILRPLDGLPPEGC